MTRINLVPPSELCREHLVAEYRELPRVFGLAHDAMLRGEKPTDDRFNQGFRLGRGHVLHFYPRLGFLADRHHALCSEMELRGYATRLRGFHFGASEWVGETWWDWWGSWTPSDVNVTESRHRILVSLARMSEKARAA